MNLLQEIYDLLLILLNSPQSHPIEETRIIDMLIKECCF